MQGGRGWTQIGEQGHQPAFPQQRQHKSAGHLRYTDACQYCFTLGFLIVSHENGLCRRHPVTIREYPR